MDLHIIKKENSFSYVKDVGTNSVTSHVAGFIQDPPDPRIAFWCHKCSDFQ